MFFALAALSLAAWVSLALFRGQFWRSGPVLPEASSALPQTRVAVVVPARNEAESIAECLESLLAQRFPGELRVIVVDDNSSDGTGAIARRIAERDARLTVITGEPLADGWTGKMWAVAQGLRRPEAQSAFYVLLTDADIVHGPGHLAALTAAAQSDNRDLVSEMVRLRCSTLAERATIPAFVFFFQMLYPFRRVANTTSRIAAAAGGTMLVSRRALEAVGDVEGIRDALIDDVALARSIKRAGYSIWLGHAEEAVSRRRYPRFADVWQMIARTAYVQLRHSPLLLAATCVGMLLLYAVPVAGLWAPGSARWMALAAWGLMALLCQPTLRRCRCSPLWGVALPAIAMFYLATTCGSAAQFYRGRGGQWKDRTYPANRARESGPPHTAE